MTNGPANTNSAVARPVNELLPELSQLLQEIKHTLQHNPELCQRIRDAPVRAAGSAEGRFARALLRERRLRERIFGNDLFSDPSWDILLDLFAAHEEGHPPSISSLCIAAAAPATTALRHVLNLTERGWIIRRSDPSDRRRVFATMAPSLVERMRAFIQQIMSTGSS